MVNNQAEFFDRVANNAEVMVFNSENVPLSSTLDNTTTLMYGSTFKPFIQIARSAVRSLNPSDDLEFLRFQRKKDEILIAPRNEFVIIVIQNCTSSN